MRSSRILGKSRVNWWIEQGINSNNLELYKVPQEELAHYSKATVDLMYRFPHGLENWKESQTEPILIWALTQKIKKIIKSKR